MTEQPRCAFCERPVEGLPADWWRHEFESLEDAEALHEECRSPHLLARLRGSGEPGTVLMYREGDVGPLSG